MRLINMDTLEFEEYYGDEAPDYAILSHRWSRNELTYVEYCNGHKKESGGYDKVLKFCNAVGRYNQYLQKAKSKARRKTPEMWSLLDQGARWNRRALYRPEQYRPGDDIAAIVDADERPIISCRGQPLVSEVPKLMKHRLEDRWLRQERLFELTPLSYLWIDTCCMNKDSSAELSEAINSSMPSSSPSERRDLG